MDAGGERKRIKLRAQEVAARELDGETILLDMASSRYLSVNSTGTLLWAALARGTTRDELARQLMVAFDIDAESAASDVDAFVNACRAEGLLES